VRDIQNKVKKLRESRNWDTKPEHLLLAMQEELGELCASFLQNHSKYNKNSNVKSRELESEIGDLLQLLFAFANEMGIDCESGITSTIKKLSE